MWKEWINRVVGITGYRISRLPSLDRDIALGRYRWLQELKIRTVLDVGANVGQFATTIRRILPEAAIYCFEPLQSCFGELTATVAEYPAIRCFPIALGNESGTKRMYHNEFSPSSSLLAVGKRHLEAFPHAQRVVEEEITVRRLDEVAGELSLIPGILLKIDVQGYELQVLSGAQRSLPLMDLLILETSFVELYEGQPLFHEIYEFLHARHFRYGGSFAQIVDASTGAVLQEDSIFFNMQREQPRNVMRQRS